MFQVVTDVTHRKKILFYLGLIWTHPSEKTHSSLPQLPNLKSLQLMEWSDAQEREIRCHVGRWPGSPCPSLASLPGQARCLQGWKPPLPKHLFLRAQTLSRIVPGSLSTSQCTYSSKKEAPGQHSGIAEAKIR